jgi:hypothetical protein
MLQTQNVFVFHIEKYVFSASNLHKKKITFGRFNIVIIEIFKFQKMYYQYAWWLKC